MRKTKRKIFKKHRFLTSLSLAMGSFLLFISLLLFYLYSIESNYTDFAQAQTLPRQYLYEQTQARGLNFDVLNRVVWCESSWRMEKNSASSAYGYFQILDSTEKYTPQYQAGQRKYDPLTNIDMGLYLYERYGLQPWLESQSCWQS